MPEPEPQTDAVAIGQCGGPVQHLHEGGIGDEPPGPKVVGRQAGAGQNGVDPNAELIQERWQVQER
jgi:hypothetical protein